MNNNKICINCAFLAHHQNQKKHDNLPTGSGLVEADNQGLDGLQSLNLNNRQQIQQNDFAFLDDNGRNFLTCHHGQWAEDEARKTTISADFLQTKTCAYHTPYDTETTRNLADYEKIRQQNHKRRQFFITNGLVMIGGIITVLIALLR